MPDPAPTLWTVGTGHRRLAELVALLGTAAIETLVDVRSYPRSHLPHFCRDEMERILPASGIDYAWLGGDLGGLREGGYRRYMASDRFSHGLDRLEEIARSRATAICCAEIDPDRCHRRFIADALVARGWAVVHLVHPHDTRAHAPAPRQDDLPFSSD